MHAPTLDDVRAHHRGAKAELLPTDLDLTDGAPRLTAEPVIAPDLAGAAA